jgi:hypothetical protein
VTKLAECGEDRHAKHNVAAAVGVPLKAANRWVKQLTEVVNYTQLPKTKRPPLTAKRMPGAGRPTDLTTEQERELREWIIARRRGPERFAVSELDIQRQAKQQYGIVAGDKWVNGFMSRNRLAMRLRTTTKEVDTSKMKEIKFHFQCKYASLLLQRPACQIFNMDECSVMKDAPHNRTVDEVGRKTIEIGTGGHTSDRVGIVICVTRACEMMDALVIHKCKEKSDEQLAKEQKEKEEKKRQKEEQKKKKQEEKENCPPAQVKRSRKPVAPKPPKPPAERKTNKLTRHELETDQGLVRMWVSHNSKAWLTSSLFKKWISEVYKVYVEQQKLATDRCVLFMDGCSVHRSEKSIAHMSQVGIRYEILPPHTTPILQPCDQNINAVFKHEYERQWRMWWETIGCSSLTRYGNNASAPEEELNRWVAASLKAITPHIIKVSWCRAMGMRYNPLLLPDKAWNVLYQFLDEEVRVDMMKDRRRYMRFKTFNFPVAKKRKKRADEEQSKASKRKKRNGEEHSTESERKEEEFEERKEEDVEKKQEERTLRREEEQMFQLGPVGLLPPVHMQLRLDPRFRVCAMR